MADDTTFNFWNEVDLTVAFHPSFGNNNANNWWSLDVGLKAAERVVNLFEEKYKNDTLVQAAWAYFGDGVGLNVRSTKQIMISSILNY
ncbi:hypothetical protein OSTOST_16578 [Ostertagia ostertagi]